MEKQITCKVEGCFADRGEGDSLFCPNCRHSWRELGIRKGFGYPLNYEGEYASNFEKERLPNLLRWFIKNRYGGKNEN